MMISKPISPAARPHDTKTYGAHNFVEKRANDYIRARPDIYNISQAFPRPAPDTAAPEDLRFFTASEARPAWGAEHQCSVAGRCVSSSPLRSTAPRGRHTHVRAEPRKIPLV